MAGVPMSAARTERANQAENAIAMTAATGGNQTRAMRADSFPLVRATHHCARVRAYCPRRWARCVDPHPPSGRMRVGSRKFRLQVYTYGRGL